MPKQVSFLAAMLAAAVFVRPANAIRMPRIELLPAARISGATVAAPERVVISRDARPVTAEEVFAAIQRALGQENAAGTEKLSPENVLLQSQILVRPGDAGLEVLRSDFDPGMKRGRFLLWPSRDPKVLPFYAAVTLPENFAPSGSLGGTHLSLSLNKRYVTLVAGKEPKPAVLVSPGESATLVLQSASLSMIAEVVPLERGVMGQQIRIRVADTGKVFRAKVDGRAHLEFRF